MEETHAEIREALWGNLSRAWVRDAQVRAVVDYRIGTAVTPMTPGRRWEFPEMFTNLPEAARMAGERLQSEGTAVVVVSDMRSDRPPQPPGTRVCGRILASGQGTVPTYFGQCLVEGWQRVPPWTTISALIAQSPNRRPIFVVVMSRNPTYSENLNRNLMEHLAGAGHAHADAENTANIRRIRLAAHQPVTPCDQACVCRYAPGTDVVVAHGEGVAVQSCRFRARARQGEHALTCRATPREAGAREWTAIRTRRTGLKAVPGQGLRVDERREEIDLSRNLQTGPERLSLRSGVEWASAEDNDLHQHIAEWLGEPWQNRDDYALTFRTVVEALLPKFASAMCAEEWVVTYVR
jgi:hypothetical protein